MADENTSDPIYAEGRTVGADCDSYAIDCPYLPGVEPKERAVWLRGFSDARVELPPREPSDVAVPPPTPHAG